MTIRVSTTLLAVLCIVASYSSNAQKNSSVNQTGKDSSVLTFHVTGPGFKRDFHFSSAESGMTCNGFSDFSGYPAKDTALRYIEIAGRVTDVNRLSLDAFIYLKNFKGPGVVPLIPNKREYLLANPDGPYVLAFQILYVSEAGGLFPGSKYNQESIDASSGHDARNTGSVTVTEYKGTGTHMKGHFAFKVWVETRYHHGVENNKPGYYDVTGDFDVIVKRI